MVMFCYGIGQAAFDAAFGGLTLDQATELILGEREPTEEQREALRLASGDGYRLRFDPRPVGHVDFCRVDSRGTGNHGYHILVPATKECRRLVNSRRREKLAEKLGDPALADAIFTACRGHEPTITEALALWPVLRHAPGLSDQALRDMGFRPNHPIEKIAIAAIRTILGVTD